MVRTGANECSWYFHWQEQCPFGVALTCKDARHQRLNNSQAIRLIQRRLREDESPLWGDEHTDDVLSLLEENARLRGLVVKLSNLILRRR